MGGNHQNLRENSGKMMLKILYEPCKGGGGEGGVHSIWRCRDTFQKKVA